MTVIKTFGLHGALYSVIAMAVGGVGGIYIGHKIQRHVKSFGTSFIGAFLFLDGVRDLVGTPALDVNKAQGFDPV